MDYAVPLEVSVYCAFDRMLACHEDDGRPSLHKLLSDSSAKCPSIREAWQ